VNAEYFRTMFAYTAWAWRRVLDQVAQVSQDDYVGSRFRDYASMRAILVHALAAEMRYLSVWKDEPLGERPDEATVPTVAELRKVWTAQEQAMAAFLAGLTDQDCLRAVKQVSARDGSESVTPLWLLMTQAVNHHTQHRSEIALMVTQLGHSPGDLDVTRYYRERKG
jgi:uncharacterized damage-inducible protein DinB